MRVASPSSLILCYTFCKSIFVAATLRTFHLADGVSADVVAIASLTTAGFALSFIAELVEKRSLLDPALKVYLSLSPYDLALVTKASFCIPA